jgi:hypothetical protein
MTQIQIDKSVHDYHQNLVGSIMVQNRSLIDDLKTVSRIMDTSNWLDDISELKFKVLKEILKPYSELNNR